MSQDSDLVHASSLPPLLVKSNCVISKENSDIISPLFPTHQNHSPLEIETLAASSAVQFALELGFSNIALEGNSQVLMQALIHDRPFLSSDGLLIDDLRFNARCFNQLHYSHVKREGNMVAHKLARYTLNVSDFVVWIEDISP